MNRQQKILTAARHLLTDPPRRPWMLNQCWTEVLFLHFPVDAEMLQTQLPAGIQVSLLENQAWVSVVLFNCRKNVLNLFGGLRIIPDYCECNIRTYVQAGAETGIHFLHLYTADILMLLAARLFTKMPYRHGAVTSIANGSKGYRYRGPQGLVRARVMPGEALQQPAPADLWLTERYTAFQADRSGALYRYEIRHNPWPLRQVLMPDIFLHCRIGPFYCRQFQFPIIHYSPGVDALLWKRQRFTP